MISRSPLRALALLIPLATACAAPSTEGRGALLAQARTCSQDSDCRMRLPRPRPCPGGGQSVPTACCRMNYCGICWSECPSGGGRTDDAANTTRTM
jgi:hypothetical protein